MNPLELQVLVLVSGVRGTDAPTNIVQERALAGLEPARRLQADFGARTPVWRSSLRDVSAYAPRDVKAG